MKDNENITITAVINGFIVEKSPGVYGIRNTSRFVYATVDALAADLLNVINHELPAQEQQKLSGICIGGFGGPIGCAYPGTKPCTGPIFDEQKAQAQGFATSGFVAPTNSPVA